MSAEKEPHAVGLLQGEVHGHDLLLISVTKKFTFLNVHHDAEGGPGGEEAAGIYLDGYGGCGIANDEPKLLLHDGILIIKEVDVLFVVEDDADEVAEVIEVAGLEGHVEAEFYDSFSGGIGFTGKERKTCSFILHEVVAVEAEAKALGIAAQPGE
jgi:hypothetical protein